MKRSAVIALLLLGACKPKPTLRVTQTAVEPGPVDAGVADAAVATSSFDAGREGAAPKPTEEPPPDDLTFTAVATFSIYSRSVHLFHLTDGVGISQSNDVDWGALTVSKTKPLQDLTVALKKTHGGGDPLWLWGSTDEVWVTDGKTRGVHASRTADPIETDVFRHVAPYHDDQWVGIPTAWPVWYMSDHQANRFVQLHPSDADAGADVPLVPKDFQIWSLASLGEGKLCGVGAQTGDGGSTYGVWWWSSTSNTKVVDISQMGEPRAFRGPEGDCHYVSGERTLSVRRLRGNHVVPIADDIAKGAFDVTSSGQALWVAPSNTHEIRRVDLTKSPVQTKRHALPTSIAGCKKLGEPNGVVAVADDDVWVLQPCEQPAYHILLHTEPAGAASVLKVKVP